MKILGFFLALAVAIVGWVASSFDAQRNIIKLQTENKLLQLDHKQKDMELDVLQHRIEILESMLKTASEEKAQQSSQSPSRDQGKEVSPDIQRFAVDTYYVASGKMGDIGDVTIAGQLFIYSAAGRGPHEWEWKYESDGRTLSSQPAQFGGVVWLSPANNFGMVLDGGYDLRGFQGIEWEARSVGEPVSVEFFAGGVDRVWQEGAEGRWEFVRAPYPDTLPRINLGIRKLTSEWQVFRVSLADHPESHFARVVGAFGWVANWANNGIEPNESGTAPRQVKKFAFEVRRVFYVKEVQP